MNIFKDLNKREFFEIETPSLKSAIGFTVVFSVFFLMTSVTSIFTHQWAFLTTWCFGLIVEIVGYAGRIWFHLDDNNNHAYIMQCVCITVAPCFLMAGVYLILSQLILIYGNHFSLLSPMTYSNLFGFFDIISLFVQGIGAGIASRPNENPNLGRYIMIAGFAFQVFTMTVFQFFWYSFLWKIYQSKRHFNEQHFNPIYGEFRQRRKLLKLFMFGVSIVVILIYVRTIYRMVETILGFDSYLFQNEIYFNILEGVMIATAALIITILAPGIVYGRHSHLYINKNGFYLVEVQNDTSKFRYNI